MSKFDTPATIRYIGLDTAKALKENPAIPLYLNAQAIEFPNSVIDVFTECKEGTKPRVDWEVTITSKTGRKFFVLRQRQVAGLLYLKPD